MYLWNGFWHAFVGFFDMFRKVNLFTTLRSGAIAAILFCIPVFIFIMDASYTQTWLLFLGCFLFLVVIFIHTWLENKNRGENESTVALIFASHVTTITGITIACIICLLMLAIFVPGYFGGEAEKVLQDVPANDETGKAKGLGFKVFMAAIIGNFTVGSFTGIILPFYSKRNQTKDTREPVPFHQRGAH